LRATKSITRTNSSILREPVHYRVTLNSLLSGGQFINRRGGIKYPWA
jgi:hypothetical protein